MVITILEGHVVPEKAKLLKASFASATRNLDPGIVETFLMSDVKDSATWRIVTVWKDRPALDAMRASGQPPRGVVMFKEVGVDPVLSIWEVASHGAV